VLARTHTQQLNSIIAAAARNRHAIVRATPLCADQLQCSASRMSAAMDTERGMHAAGTRPHNTLIPLLWT